MLRRLLLNGSSTNELAYIAGSTAIGNPASFPSTPSSVTVSVPAGAATGDLIVIIVARANFTGVSTPAGFTVLGSTSGSTECVAYAGVWNGTTTSFTFTGSNTTGDQSAAILMVFRDALYGGNFAADRGGGGGAVPSITIPVNNSLRVVFAAESGTRTGVTPSGFIAGPLVVATSWPGASSTRTIAAFVSASQLPSGATGTLTDNFWNPTSASDTFGNFSLSPR